MTLVSLLTLPEVCEALRLSRRTVYRLIAAGRLRPTRIGGRVLVKESEVRAFIAACDRDRVA